MTLQDEILNQMEQVTPEEKETIAAFLQKTFTQNPSKQVNLEARSVKSVKCVESGSWSTIAVPNSKLESIAEWLIGEGFTLLNGYSPKGTFWGYKVFLCDKYAPL